MGNRGRQSLSESENGTDASPSTWWKFNDSLDYVLRIQDKQRSFHGAGYQSINQTCVWSFRIVQSAHMHWTAVLDIGRTYLSNTVHHGSNPGVRDAIRPCEFGSLDQRRSDSFCCIDSGWIRVSCNIFFITCCGCIISFCGIWVFKLKCPYSIPKRWRRIKLNSFSSKSHLSCRSGGGVISIRGSTVTTIFKITFSVSRYNSHVKHLSTINFELSVKQSVFNPKTFSWIRKLEN